MSGSLQTDVRLLGENLQADDLILAGPGVRMDLLIRTGAALFALIAASPGSMSRRAWQVCAGVETSAGDAAALARYMRNPKAYGDIEPSLASRLHNVVATSSILERGVRTPRVSAVVCACRLIDERFPAALSISDLSQHCGVAERTLEYGFQHVYGTTPLTFIRSQRLTRSRLALLHAKRRTSISETARAFGFTHMGQYCRDYRRLFGETPSMTLARRRSTPSLCTEA